MVKSYGLQREFITPFSPKQNGTVERVIRTLKDQCVRRYRFETLQYARRVLVSGLAFTTTSGPTVTADTNAYWDLCFSSSVHAQTAASVRRL